MADNISAKILAIRLISTFGSDTELVSCQYTEKFPIKFACTSSFDEIKLMTSTLTKKKKSTCLSIQNVTLFRKPE